MTPYQILSDLRSGLCEVPCRSRDEMSGCTCAGAANLIERLRSTLADILGPQEVADILWGDKADDEMVTILLKLQTYREANKGLWR